MRRLSQSAGRGCTGDDICHTAFHCIECLHMSTTSLLYELEELDTAIESDEATFAANQARIGDRDILDRAQQQVQAARDTLAELKKQHRAAEAEVDDLLAKIASDEGKLYSGSIMSPKELSSLQKEISLQKERGDELENKALVIIEQVEKQEQNVVRLEASMSKLEQDWQSEQEKLKAENGQIETRLKELKKKRAETARQIEPETLEQYEFIRKRKKPAVARVEKGICQSCRVSPSSSALQRARSGQPVLCSCGRLLYVS